MKPKFVEARLHTDMTAGHKNFRYNKRIQEIRARFLGAGNLGLPQYLIVSPSAPYKPLATKFDGAGGGIEGFRKFFAAAGSSNGG